MKLISALLCALVIALVIHNPARADHLDEFFSDSLDYLKDIPEIAWFKIDEKNVIIGWKGLPRQFSAINRKAAVKASNATGFPVIVWSVRHSQKDYRTGTTPYICNTTADRGKVLKSNCRS